MLHIRELGSMDQNWVGPIRAMTRPPQDVDVLGRPRPKHSRKLTGLEIRAELNRTRTKYIFENQESPDSWFIFDCHLTTVRLKDLTSGLVIITE